MPGSVRRRFLGVMKIQLLGSSGALDAPPWDAAETGWVEALLGEKCA